LLVLVEVLVQEDRKELIENLVWRRVLRGYGRKLIPPEENELHPRKVEPQ